MRRAKTKTTKKRSHQLTKKPHHTTKHCRLATKTGCTICKTNCIEEAPKITCHIRPNTRSYAKLLNDFIIIEVYRSMPLLGNETDNAPNWDAHIVRYSVVFVNNSKLLDKYLSMWKN